MRTYFLPFHGQNVENEDHFSNLVLMRTKSSIKDLFATTGSGIIALDVQSCFLTRRRRGEVKDTARLVEGFPPKKCEYISFPDQWKVFYLLSTHALAWEPGSHRVRLVEKQPAMILQLSIIRNWVKYASLEPAMVLQSSVYQKLGQICKSRDRLKLT